MNRYLLRLVLWASIASGMMATRAEELIDCENLSRWEGMVQPNKDVKRSGAFSFELYGKYPTRLASADMIPIDMNKVYTLSGWFRTLDEKHQASANFGLEMYDEHKRMICYCNVSVKPGTEANLMADVEKGGKVLMVTKNSKWLELMNTPVPNNTLIAFNADDNNRDLPNFDLSCSFMEITDENDHYRVELREPLATAFKAGTKLRLHAPWGAPLYWIADGWMPTEWKQFSTILTGEAANGTPEDQFWKGTKFVRIIVKFGNYNRLPDNEARLLVDDISFVCRERTPQEQKQKSEWDKDKAEHEARATICRNPQSALSIDQQWRFQTDPKDEGLAKGWMKTDFPDQNWPFINADGWWQDQGYPNYHGVAWYRKTIPIIMPEKKRNCFLHFGAIDGDAAIFINDRKIGEHNLLPNGSGWDSPLYFDLSEFVTDGKTTTIAVRVKKTAYKCGIFKGVKIIMTE